MLSEIWKMTFALVFNLLWSEQKVLCKKYPNMPIQEELRVLQQFEVQHKAKEMVETSTNQLTSENPTLRLNLK